MNELDEQRAFKIARDWSVPVRPGRDSSCGVVSRRRIAAVRAVWNGATDR
jgi:hypothetical protein